MQSGMPQGIAVSGVQRYQICIGVPREQQASRGAEKAGASASTVARPLVAPANLAGLGIDRLHHGFGITAAIVAAPSFRLVVFVVQIVNAPGAGSVGVEQAGIGAITRRRPVDRATLIRRDERAVRLGLLRWIQARLSLGIDP